ncbi:hypothetical protein AJ79_04195 [Helicocarpus griseus UAMH5409]|uniref:Zn(2)-C6 fungal-type domain-containing protein n=1 Tax=Helicocarpus griseus UAMH5409 TaxID=1447875 RepID=A0A2B7XLF2_9EURO|nr:hypothetical protein AJ79_04195 [Helicocarpus griseus UAMH5409]
MVLKRSSPSADDSAPPEGNVRKRVCKACDRCRMKKSKCDGTCPCGRCQADNAICQYGERRKAADKVYPKGYVETLEDQMQTLVKGIQDLYKMILEGGIWPGEPLREVNGKPLTHDILARLGHLKEDSHGNVQHFEEDVDKIQQKLIDNGAELMQRQESTDGSEGGNSPAIARRSGSFEGPFTMNFHRFPPTPPSPHSLQQLPYGLWEGVSLQSQPHHDYLLHQRQRHRRLHREHITKQYNLPIHRQTRQRQHVEGQQYQQDQSVLQQQNQQQQQQSQPPPPPPPPPQQQQQQFSCPPAMQSQMFFSAPGAEPSLNPNLLQQPHSWPPGGGLEENLGITHLDSPLISFEALQQGPTCRPMALSAELNPCLPVPGYNDEEVLDFKRMN